MSLNTILLDSQLLADLYPNQLVDSGTTTVPEKRAKSEEWRARHALHSSLFALAISVDLIRISLNCQLGIRKHFFRFRFKLFQGGIFRAEMPDQ